jgi:antitoxin ParD1/3/4
MRVSAGSAGNTSFYSLCFGEKGMSAVAQEKPHTVDLTPDLEIAIRRRLESGGYESALDVIRAGLEALERAEEEQARRLAEFDAAIERGLADADAGRVHPAEEVFRELREVIQQELAARRR